MIDDNTIERKRADVLRDAGTEHDASRAAWRQWLWLALLPVCLLLYSTSFNDFPVIDRQHSVLGDGDAAQFRLLLEDFSLTRVYGNEYETVNRGLEDIAQKHKIHHPIYGIVGGGVSRVLQTLYPIFGLTRHHAIYSVNALIGCLNLLLLFLLMRRLDHPERERWPFLILYAAALSTWIFSSIPESWPLTASLVMLYLMALQRQNYRPYLLGIGLGVVMLNNVFLATMFLLLCLRSLREGKPDVRWFGQTFAAGLLAVATWAAGLTILSFFDPAYRPDHFIQYTLWFRDFTAPDLARTDPYVWKSAFSNLFMTSIVSNQPDPRVPQESLLFTLQSSRLGAVATITWVLLLLTAAVAFVRKLRIEHKGTTTRQLAGAFSSILLAWVLIMAMVTGLVFYQSGFLYSTVVVPAVIALLYYSLDLRVLWIRLLYGGAVALILLNNLQQIGTFRRALALM